MQMVGRAGGIRSRRHFRFRWPVSGVREGTISGCWIDQKGREGRGGLTVMLISIGTLSHVGVLPS